MNDGAETIKRLAEEEPTAHPLAWQLRFAPHEYKPPEHLRDIHGDVFRAMSRRHPNAPTKIAKIYPRDHGKSQTGAADIPAWVVCHNPNNRVLLMSETADQAKDLKRQAEAVLGVESGEVTPGSAADVLGLEVSQHTQKKLTLKRPAAHREPTITAAGFDTGVTGGHFDVLVYDDVVSWKSQRTEARRRKSWQQFSDYSQNLGTEGDSVHLVLGTRKHPDDLYSKLESSVGWSVTTLKAIQDWSVVENREFVVVTTDGERIDGSSLGDIDPTKQTVSTVEPKRDVEVLWPDRYPLSVMLKRYVGAMGADGEGTLIWKRENQNDPEALMGQVLGEDMLHFADELPGGRPIDNRRLRFLAGVDIGLEADPERAAANDTDYWAVALGGKDPDSGTVYLVDVHRRRGMSLQKGISWVQAKLSDYRPSRVMVEANQAQRWFVQTAKDEGLRFSQTTSKGSKEDRIISMSSRFESGRVKLWDPETHPVTGRAQRSDKWAGFINEWAAFPTGEHDDRLDAVEIMLRALGLEEIQRSSRKLTDLPV